MNRWITEPWTIKDVEPGVRAVLSELNAKGQKTIMSCEGHGNQRGWISFVDKTFNKTIALAIMKKHGLKRIVFFKDKDQSGVTFCKFSKLGK
jgi:hypothetical protein